MVEILLAGALLAMLLGLATLGAQALLLAGLALGVLGLVASTVAGLVYHLRLRAVLARRGPLPRRWWWSPSRFHAELSAADRREFLPWWRGGGAAFGVCLLGLVMIATSIAKAYFFVR